MIGLAYESNIEGVSVSAAQDLFELLAPSDATCLIDSLTVEKSADATSENLRLTVSRVTGAPTSGSGGGTITPTPLCPGASAAGATVERNNTTQISGGTSVKVQDRAFNLVGGIDIIFDPPIEISPSTRCVVAITAPGAARTISAKLSHREVGG